MRFVRRVLNERERHEGLERCDGLLERWKLAGRVSSVLEWKRNELGLTVRELNKRRHRLKAQRDGLGLWAIETQGELAGSQGGEARGKGKKIKSTVREELRRELEREIRAEEEAERKLNLEEGGMGMGDGGEVVLARQHAEMESDEIQSEDEVSAVVFGGEETEASGDAAAQNPADEKEVVNVKKDAETWEQKKKKRLDDVDIMIRLLDDHEKELEVAAEGLWRAAEFLAGRYVSLSHFLFNCRILTNANVILLVDSPPKKQPSKLTIIANSRITPSPSTDRPEQTRQKALKHR